MRWLLLVMALACAGCTVTLNGTGKWNDAPAASVGDAAKLNQLNGLIQAMAKELATTPDELGAVDAVLAKYGFNRGSK